MGIEPNLFIVFPSFLIGIGMILRYRLHQAKIEAGQNTEELRTAMHDLQAELHERIDFAERLLTARPQEGAEEKAATPA